MLVALLAAAGLVYQSLASARDQRDFPPPGRLVDIGGFRLHIYCTGSTNAHRPTVILESGLGSPTPIWYPVQREVALRARVCAYDRAGIGWSERSPHPRDATHIANELHALLGNSRIPTPYVLVGHSSGGLYVRAYQRLYPHDVSGMVLLDTTPERFGDVSKAAADERERATVSFTLATALVRFGVVRLLPVCRQGLPADFPAIQAAQYRALCAQSSVWSVERQEHLLLNDGLPRAVSMNIPLGVFTSGKNVKRLAVWGELQNKLAALSSNSVHIVFPMADHASFLVEKSYAHETSVLILSVLDGVKTGQRLDSLVRTPVSHGHLGVSKKTNI